MTVKENLLAWLKASSKRQHRTAPEVVEKKEEERESQPEKKTRGKAKEAEVHQDTDQ